MSPHIGIVTAENSMERIRQVDGEMRKLCDVTYLSYSTLGHLADIYTKTAHMFDGLLFSGRFNYLYVINHVGAVLKPHVTLELTDRDYYKLFTRLFYRHPGMDIRRVLMEPPLTPMDFSDVFGEVAPRYNGMRVEPDLQLENAYQRVYDESLRCWQAGEVDRVVTRFTSLEAPLRAAGVPVEVLFPSRQTILESFNQLYSIIQARELRDSMAVFGLVKHTGSEKANARVAALLEDFNALNGMSLVIRKNGDAYEVTTSNEVLLDVTQGYTNCLLTGYLHENMEDEGACVGWGIGRDVVDAYKNAGLALRATEKNRHHQAFLINQDGERVGPLVSGRSVILQTMPVAGMAALSRRMGISLLNLQKLAALREKRGKALYSSAELAFHMNITPRSANRILAKLVQFGCGRVAQSSQPTSRGRPSYVYELDFDELARLMAEPA